MIDQLITMINSQPPNCNRCVAPLLGLLRLGALQGVVAMTQEVLGDVALGHGILQFAHVPQNQQQLVMLNGG